MSTGIQLTKVDPNNQDCVEQYESLVGSLMYLTVCCRPDLAYSASYFSQFDNSCSKKHFNHLKRVLKYIKNTISHDLMFERSDSKVTNVTVFFLFRLGQ